MHKHSAKDLSFPMSEITIYHELLTAKWLECNRANPNSCHVAMGMVDNAA
jgi:hypothetical protein